MRSSASFDRVIEQLENSRRKVIEELRSGPSAGDVALKEELEWAIGCLRLCRKHEVSREDEAFQLVRPVQTPSADIRLMFDNESDDRSLWTELRLDGRHVRPTDGDVLILKRSNH